MDIYCARGIRDRILQTISHFISAPLPTRRGMLAINLWGDLVRITGRVAQLSEYVLLTADVPISNGPLGDPPSTYYVGHVRTSSEFLWAGTHVDAEVDEEATEVVEEPEFRYYGSRE